MAGALLAALTTPKGTFLKSSYGDIFMESRHFGGRIAAILEADKYHRNAAGVIEGWGRKWLP